MHRAILQRAVSKAADADAASGAVPDTLQSRSASTSTTTRSADRIGPGLGSAADSPGLPYRAPSSGRANVFASRFASTSDPVLSADPAAAHPRRADRTASRAALCALLVGLSLAAGCAGSAGSAQYSTLREPHERAQTAAGSRADEAHELDGPVLERSAFVAAVLRRNPTIEAARQGWRAALGKLRQAGTLEDPMIDLGVAPLSVTSKEAPFGFEASVSQKLPWFGKRSLEAAAASAEAEAVKSDYESVRRELALCAVMLYEQYFIAARALDINTAHVELMRALHEAALAQLSSGRGSAQDALQADGELAHMEHDAVILEVQRDVTLAQMNELLHRAPEMALPPPPAQLAPPPRLDASAARLQELALQGRPDIQAVERRAQAARARADRADRELYPDLTLSTSYNSMWDMPAHRWMVGLGFNLPIQTGAREGAAEEARAMGAQLDQEATRLRDSARTQVFTASKQLEESEHVLRLFETRLLPIAKQRIEAARSGFITAKNPFMAVIDAERSLRALELDYQKVRAEHVGRRAELDRALGRIPGIDWKEGTP